MARTRMVGALAAVLVLPALTVVAATSPASAEVATPKVAAPSDMRELTRKDFTLDGRPVETPARYQPRTGARTQAQAVQTPAVGTVRQWLGSDDAHGTLYRKDYTLRAVGEHIEVWVANDLAFPAGDCRAQVPTSTQITDAQVNYLVDEFDNNMYPKETKAFSTPPDRDGTHARIKPDANGNGGVYTGAGNKTVTLVDNVRDDNYYSFPAAPTYVAGFFSADINEQVDRNVMTIDAFDWLHRMTANPLDEPTNDLCTSRAARPYSYEGIFAHEWQHLLQYYADPHETNWINEGLSDFAMSLTGYSDSKATVFDRGAESHLYCYQGFGIVQTPYNANPRDCGGPENSLTLWGESPNPNAVLADYGNAYSFMLFLYDRYGMDFMSRLHRDGARQGLASLDAQLESVKVHDVYQVIHDYQSMTLLDKVVGDARLGITLGVSKSRVTTPSLRSTVNLASAAANGTPGAAPNGADYVQLGAGKGKLFSGRDLKSVKFQGAKTLPALPLTWTTTTQDADRPGNAVLFSGNASNLDSTAVTSVAVPTTDPTLRFTAKYGAEFGYDYGYVTVSTDGGTTYTAIPGDHTVDGPFGPALNGTTEGFEARSYDLSAYAGKTVLLGFRYVSDGGVNEGGLLLDDITVGGKTVSDGASLAPFDSPTEIRPTAVKNWNLRLVGIDEKHSIAWQFESNGKSDVTIGKLELAVLDAFPKVVAIVAYDDPTEQVTQYAPYKLTVNGVVQPGGSSSLS
ncbi:choice-of-anchor J domain-containing protein [Micromonospora chokoriensis]|uniref:choice-of-anchor J domain-containing protein n=1 Tax=Micromonospora chokoriensis TaxID=356851 RepID=UPI0004C2BD1D|nr:choice-of-anchor J domain-containing protein [Micromonospora chokoriensis]